VSGSLDGRRLRFLDWWFILCTSYQASLCAEV
jgi:hypothetical protein